MTDKMELDGWGLLYRKGRRAKYPNEMLIRFINKIFPYTEDISRNKIKILDLGFGTGRHLVYLASEGFNVEGVEISKIGFQIAKDWLSDLDLIALIQNQSLMEINLEEQAYDAVLDVACLQHNNYDQMKVIVDKVYDSLKIGGHFFSYLKSINDSHRLLGLKISDKTYAYSNIIDKVDAQTIITFTDLDDVKNLFNKFKSVEIEKEEWTYDGMQKVISHWVISAKK